MADDAQNECYDADRASKNPVRPLLVHLHLDRRDADRQYDAHEQRRRRRRHHLCDIGIAAAGRRGGAARRDE